MRSFDSMRRLLLAGTCAGWGCGEHPTKEVELLPTPPEPDPSRVIAEVMERDIDILFVIDDSASMGEEQATLAANFGAFIEVLERPEVAANYRIGVTTTDNGNPWCGSTDPEAGALQLRSCRGRPEAFTFEGPEHIDVTEQACLERCPEQWAHIETLPTAVHGQAELRPRNWIESIEGRTNLPEGLSTTQAFQCIGPQGIDGCGFESPLESMWTAVRRSSTDGDPDFGFIRSHAQLLVVFVTDEADCSYDREHESIFLPDGNRVFWSDQEASAPTSAVCWNAGVACNGAGPYDCHAVDLDVDGQHVAVEDAEDLAVLRPMSRYIELLQELEDHKQQIFPDRELLVAVIGGVNDDGSVTYDDAVGDPSFQHDFGIGPGCESESGRAVPPVRLRELAEAFAGHDQPALHSICDEDYTDALGTLAHSLVGQIRPSCMPICVADVDPSTPGTLEPSCELVQDVPEHIEGFESFEDQEVPRCEPDGALPDGHDVCWLPLTGDERSTWCSDQGFNLELRLLRRKGVYVPSGTVVRATCEPSLDVESDCPDLP